MEPNPYAMLQRLERDLDRVKRAVAGPYIPQSLLSTQGQVIVRGATAPEAGVRPTRVLAFQCSASVAGLSTTGGVLTEAGVVRAVGGMADAVIFRYNASDWTVGGVDPTFVLITTFSNNATAPGVTINGFLSRITALAGGSGVLSATITPAITNAHAGMTAGLISQVASSATALSDGQSYLFAVGTASGSQAAASTMNVSSKLFALYP